MKKLYKIIMAAGAVAAVLAFVWPQGTRLAAQTFSNSGDVGGNIIQGGTIIIDGDVVGVAPDRGYEEQGELDAVINSQIVDSFSLGRDETKYVLGGPNRITFRNYSWRGYATLFWNGAERRVNYGEAVEFSHNEKTCELILDGVDGNAYSAQMTIFC